MRHVEYIKPVRLLAGLLIALFSAVSAMQLIAQPAVDSQPRHSLNSSYDKAHEITLNGTVQEVISKRTAHSLVGMHLLVAGPQGLVDAHLGPYLSKDVEEALHTGEPVQIVGAMEKLHGTNYLLARQLIFAGRLVTVRSERGFLLRGHSSRVARSQTRQTTAQVELNGGGR